ncbi:MAG TPA: DUF4383 domain-containing protein [Ornithinibacter sp.]|nr:DUF4383 domain-containing protein [Ornithinibacter sp.]
MRSPEPTVDLPTARDVASTVGSIFLVVGCLGFLPGVTTNLEGLRLTGPGSSTALVDLVPVTVAGNVVHLALALAAKSWARTEDRARAFLVVGGALYAGLCARSIVIGTGTTSDGSVRPGLWTALLAGLTMMAVAGAAGRRLQIRHRGMPGPRVSDGSG